MNRAKFDCLLETLDKLKDLSTDTPVIVEGKMDEKALREIGVTGPVYQVQTASSVFEFCEDVAKDHREALLFTDLDAAGKKIGRVVKKYLTDKGVKVDDNIAKKFLHTLDIVETEKVAVRLERVCRKFSSP
ncbi:MAG: toprim domain-containing protein [Candidatus Hydrothermarchaeales archaeon]